MRHNFCRCLFGTRRQIVGILPSGADTAPFSVAVAGTANDYVTSGERRSKDTAFEQKLNGQPFFVTGSWDVVNVSGISVYVPKGIGADGAKRAAELAALMSEAKTYMSGVLGTAPAVPFQIVASRRGGGFSTAGTVIVDESVFRRSKIDSLTAMNVVEAVAKVWLGGSVSITGDGNGVISEGLSRFLVNTVSRK